MSNGAYIENYFHEACDATPPILAFGAHHYFQPGISLVASVGCMVLLLILRRLLDDAVVARNNDVEQIPRGNEKQKARCRLCPCSNARCDEDAHGTSYPSGLVGNDVDADLKVLCHLVTAASVLPRANQWELVRELRLLFPGMPAMPDFLHLSRHALLQEARKKQGPGHARRRRSFGELMPFMPFNQSRAVRFCYPFF